MSISETLPCSSKECDFTQKGRLWRAEFNPNTEKMTKSLLLTSTVQLICIVECYIEKVAENGSQSSLCQSEWTRLYSGSNPQIFASLINKGLVFLHCACPLWVVSEVCSSYSFRDQTDGAGGATILMLPGAVLEKRGT